MEESKRNEIKRAEKSRERVEMIGNVENKERRE